ncbi:MAG TPA: hypothetical protein VK658_21900 [Chryseolinea sp.]|nr:hypothetical protein [Chryseolinea sp.]
MARDSINNIICDNILRKFDGHKSISRAKMRDTKFYSNIDADWEVVERHIDFLIHDRTLKEDDATLSLTNKGWFMLNHAEKVGYVAQKIDDVQWRKSEGDTRTVVRVTIFVAAGVTILWVLLRLISLLAR